MLELNHAKPEPLVRFLPLILNKLIQLMVKPPSVLGQVMNTGQTAFEAIAMLVRNVTVSAVVLEVSAYEYKLRDGICLTISVQIHLHCFSLVLGFSICAVGYSLCKTLLIARPK
jgi:hypothetical protein